MAMRDFEELRFSEEFLALWDPPSKVSKTWSALEGLHRGLRLEAERTMVLLDSSGTLRHIEQTLLTRPHPGLIFESLLLMWRRVVLRTTLKVGDSLTLLFHCCNSQQLFGAVLSTRAVLEHIAGFQEFVDSVPWKDSPLIENPKPKLTAFYKLLQKSACGSYFPWDKLFSDSATRRQLLADPSQVRAREERLSGIGKTVERLDEAMSGDSREPIIGLDPGFVRVWYRMLSDVVHPGWGADILYADDMTGALRSRDVGDKVLRRGFRLFALPIIEVVYYFSRTLKVLEDHEPASVGLVELEDGPSPTA
jgi:hypothetical protein